MQKNSRKEMAEQMRRSELSKSQQHFYACWSDVMLMNFDQLFTSSRENGRLKREQDQETMIIDRLRKV